MEDRISLKAFEIIGKKTNPLYSDEKIKSLFKEWDESGEGFSTFCRSREEINMTSFLEGLGRLNLPRP